MGVTHFLMKHLPEVATEMAQHVLAYRPPSKVGFGISAIIGRLLRRPINFDERAVF
jgi:hypothetical protein